MTNKDVARVAQIESRILFIRGQRVMLSHHLAELYGVAAKALTQAVRRNIERFPSDFMFELSAEEAAFLRSQFVTLETGRGKYSKYRPYAFTEQGVAMLASVLRSPRAVAVSIEVVRAFVRLRQLLSSNAELARKLAALERRYDSQFKDVFDAIRQLMTPPEGRRSDRSGSRRGKNLKVTICDLKAALFAQPSFQAFLRLVVGHSASLIHRRLATMDLGVQIKVVSDVFQSARLWKARQQLRCFLLGCKWHSGHVGASRFLWRV